MTARRNQAALVPSQSWYALWGRRLRAGDAALQRGRGGRLIAAM